MKKTLFATTALVMSAGVAAADVTISGYGRAAIDYQEGRTEEAQIDTRVRFNIDGSTTTDQGVDFGARVRLQYDDGNSNSTTSPGYVYVTSGGLTVSMGNVGTAFDSVGLLYESEVGLISRSYGNTQGSFYAFSTGGYGVENDRMGVAAEYSVGGFTGRLSYVDPDQTAGSPIGSSEEVGISIDYEWNQIQLSAAAVQNGAGIDNNDQYFVGAYYTMPGTSNGIGLNWLDNGPTAFDSQTVVLYGDYEVAPMTTLSAYIANNDAPGNATDNAFGIGAKYDLGGAILAGSIERGYNENIRSDMGIKFNF
ncbi:outer membrane protein OmpU [Paracoccus isoporae]|uniref:Outer membrane protein OmpU n=1 Tax=Paracoccus isoporae TaxID=591205 RepID=A0A1G6YXK4_9RHOB|nr:porin [Paracoccus isoporae]SDD95234.1 outer membrane protein OmpU [Paracoccus isoporae]